MCDVQKWSERYNAVIESPPKEGDVLSSASGGPAVLTVELSEGTPPFIYGRAYVPEIISDDVRWCLQEENTSSYHGWKCILMPRARTELLRKVKLTNETVNIKSLRVVRPSQSGKSLLCEVAEFYLEKVEVEADDTGTDNNVSEEK